MCRCSRVAATLQDKHKGRERDRSPSSDRKRQREEEGDQQGGQGKERASPPAPAAFEQPRPSAKEERAAAADAAKQELRRAPSQRERDRKLFGTALTAAVRDTRAGEEEKTRHRSSKRHRN